MQGDSEKNNKCRIMHKFNVFERSSQQYKVVTLAGPRLRAEGRAFKGSISLSGCITTALCVALKLYSMLL